MAGVSLEKARVRSRMIVSPRAMVKKKKTGNERTY